MTGCVLVGTAASVYCLSLSAEKQKDNSFPGSPVLHKIKAADEEDKDYSEDDEGRWLQFVWEGSLSLPAPS